MKAITVSDPEAGAASLALTELPRPEAATNDVVVRVHAASFIHTELDWPDTWTDRAGRDRTPSVPGHDVSGVVVERAASVRPAPANRSKPSAGRSTRPATASSWAKEQLR